MGVDKELLKLIKKDLKEKKMRGTLGTGSSSYSSGGMSSGGTGWQSRRTSPKVEEQVSAIS